MKNEDKMVERLGNLEKGFSSFDKGLSNLEKRQKEDNDRIVSAVNTLTDIMKAWSCPTGMEKTKDMENLRARLDRIE